MWPAGIPASLSYRSSNVSAPARGRRPITTVPSSNEPRINDRIRAREVRLVDAEGRQLGITPLAQALAIAQQQDLDLVEVAPLANPPVCRIMDYGKFKFDAAQRAKESRRKTSNIGIKEMKYRPKIGPGDFETKTRQVLRFLNEGHKVKVTVMFRGREVIHPDLGKRILDRIAEQIDGVAKIETEGRLDGRNMVMVLAPDKRAKQSSEAKHLTEERSRVATNGNAPAPEVPPVELAAPEPAGAGFGAGGEPPLDEQQHRHERAIGPEATRSDGPGRRQSRHRCVVCQDEDRTEYEGEGVRRCRSRRRTGEQWPVSRSPGPGRSGAGSRTVATCWRRSRLFARRRLGHEVGVSSADRKSVRRLLGI